MYTNRFLVIVLLSILSAEFSFRLPSNGFRIKNIELNTGDEFPKIDNQFDLATQIRSLNLRDCTGDRKIFDNLMTDGKSVIVFLRHLG